MTLESLLPRLGFEPIIEEAIMQKIAKNGHQIKCIAETAYQSSDFDFPLCRRMPLTRLAVVAYLLTSKYDAYKTAGIADGIILDTFQDVSLRANLFYDQSGKIGIPKEDVIWFRHIMDVNIFKIGVLQFQAFKMLYLDEETIGEPYMVFSENQKKRLPAGTDVINIHIQKGANINPAAVRDSLERASIFFKTHYESIPYRAFICYSWLLYPPMLQRLPEKSNIKQFAEYFSIIGVCNDPAQAKENLRFRHNPDAPVPSSLQKMAKEHKEILGYACGVIML